MTTKIRVKVGPVEVDYEGPEAFLNKKLPDLVSHLSSLANRVPESGETGKGDSQPGGANRRHGSAGTLASFLRETKAKSSNNKKFLGTAEWLHRKGHQELKTSDVTKALHDNHQGQVGNASQCLNNNVKSGYCVKRGRAFYVTDEGREALK